MAFPIIPLIGLIASTASGVGKAVAGKRRRDRAKSEKERIEEYNETLADRNQGMDPSLLASGPPVVGTTAGLSLHSSPFQDTGIGMGTLPTQFGPQGGSVLPLMFGLGAQLSQFQQPPQQQQAMGGPSGGQPVITQPPQNGMIMEPPRLTSNKPQQAPTFNTAGYLINGK